MAVAEQRRPLAAHVRHLGTHLAPRRADALPAGVRSRASVVTTAVTASLFWKSTT